MSVELNETIPELALEQGQPLPRQIADYVRERIRRGDWQPGDRLPPSLELAALWGTNAATIHRAFKPLVAEGLLDRRSRAGTFVRQPAPVLETVGIYLAAGVLSHGFSPFSEVLVKALRSKLAEAGLEVQFFFDPRPEVDYSKPWPLLVEAVERRQVQALIVPALDAARGPWLRKLPVPVAAFGGGLLVNVTFDTEQFVRLALDALIAQGCRRVGMITAHHLYAEDMALMLRKRAQLLNVESRPEWMMLPDHPIASGAPGQQQFGYEAMHRLWAAPEYPDGLIVYADTVAGGVVIALLELGVRVGEELHLALHRNRGVPLLCPLPASFIELDPDAIAALLVRHVREQSTGRPMGQMRVCHSLVETPAPVPTATS